MTTTDKHTPTAAEVADGSAGTPAEEQTGLAQYNADVLARRPELVEAFLAMLEDVPEPDDDAAASIIGTILGAESAADLNKPWESDGMANYYGEVVIVESITKRPSDYTGGLGVYLGCMCYIERTGERLFVTCGGVSAVAQLVRAHTLGALPLAVIPTKARKATTNGYWPYHLEVMKARLPQ